MCYWGYWYMIRGAIDYIDQHRVGGWLHSDASAVKGQTVLAFLNKECVGAGTVEQFRQDLADAGLGDGYVGFNFGISVPDDAAPEAVVVKIDGSDLVLMQSASSVVGANDDVAATPHRTYTIDAIEWMRERGWLEQTDFDFLKGVSSIGLYDRSLRQGREMGDPQVEAAHLFELFAQGPVKVETKTIDLGELETLRHSLIKDAVLPIVAVHANAGAISIVEGSQLDDDWFKGGNMTGAVDYKLGADRLVFVDLRASLAALGDASATLYYCA